MKNFFLLLFIVSWAIAVNGKHELQRENEARKQDLAKAQARLDQFYDPAKETATVDGLKLKAIPELGDNTSGYLVLQFRRVGFTEMCRAGFRSSDGYVSTGKEFHCPTFAR